MALVNEGLARASARLGKSLAILLLVLLTSTAHAKTFCMALVHGKGGAYLADPSWAADYWSNGQFQSIAQPCGGMPVLITHADGTYGTDVAFDRAYCGCGYTSPYGCSYLRRPADGSFDSGVNGAWPHAKGMYSENPNAPNQGYCLTTLVSPKQWPVPSAYQGVLEQINTFLDQTGCTDLTIVTHSNGGPIIRWGFSLTTVYESASNCVVNGVTDPACALRKQHQLRVINATSTVIQLHPPNAGSEAADLAGTLSGNWLTGWLADWLGGNNPATLELTTARLLDRNTRFMYGTSNPAYTTNLTSRPWPSYTAKGEYMHPVRWIAFISYQSAINVVEDAAHAQDFELAGCAAAVPFRDGSSDGLVSNWSQRAVGDVWIFHGQHDAAANAYTVSQLNGNNHYHPLLGAAAGGQWRPVYWYQEPTYYYPASVASPPLQGPGPCFTNAAGYICPGWPTPSVYHGIAVPACHDLTCKYNQTRGNPNGADEAFEVSAYVEARAAAACGPAISNLNIPNGQHQDYFLLVKDTAVPARFQPYWQLWGRNDLYDTYAPNAGTQVCQWQC